MHCMRCQGLMIRDHFFDFDGTTGHMWACSWRCMNCGHVYDAVIEQNRRAAREPVPARVDHHHDSATIEPDALAHVA